MGMGGRAGTGEGEGGDGAGRLQRESRSSGCPLQLLGRRLQLLGRRAAVVRLRVAVVTLARNHHLFCFETVVQRPLCETFQDGGGGAGGALSWASFAVTEAWPQALTQPQ